MQSRLTLIKLIKNSYAHSRKSHPPLYSFHFYFIFFLGSPLSQDIGRHGRPSQATKKTLLGRPLRVLFYFIFSCWNGEKGEKRGQRRRKLGEWWVNTTNNLMGTRRERKKESEAPSNHEQNRHAFLAISMLLGDGRLKRTFTCLRSPAVHCFLMRRRVILYFLFALTVGRRKKAKITWDPQSDSARLTCPLLHRDGLNDISAFVYSRLLYRDLPFSRRTWAAASVGEHAGIDGRCAYIS